MFAETDIVCGLTGEESHIPLPTRLADPETHRMRKELMAYEGDWIRRDG